MPRESLAPLTSRLLGRLDVSKECARRRELYAWYAQAFADVSGVRPVFGRLAEGVVPQGFPLWFTTNDAIDLVRQWRRSGIPIVSWPELPNDILPHAPPHYRNLLLIPFLW